MAFLVWFGTAQATDRYWITLGIEAMWVGAALIGLNLLLGYTGLLSLGHYVFFIVGGFVGAIWAVEDWGLDPWLGFPVAFVVGMTLGALLALTCCHLRGFYLTVVTIAFGLVSSAFALLFEGLFNGLPGRPVAEPLDTSFGFLDASNPNRPFVGLYWIGVVMLLLVLYVARNLLRSRWGRAYKAIREAELAAQACGVRPTGTRCRRSRSRPGWSRRPACSRRRRTCRSRWSTGRASSAGRSMADRPHRGRPRHARRARRRRVRVHARARRRDRREHDLGSPRQWETLFVAALVIGRSILARPRASSVHSTARARRWHAGSASPGDSRPRRRCRAELAVPRPQHPPGEGEVDGNELLRVEGVTIRFGGLAAVRAVDLTVRAGEVHGLIGPNGSGKSTLVNVVTGVYRPETGRIRFRGELIGGLTTHAVSRRGIARTFQNVQIWRRMTVLENVMVGLHGRTRVDLARSLLLPVWLRPRSGASASAPAGCWRSSGSRGTNTTSPARCRTRTSGGSRSPARWPRIPISSSSTSRRPG